MLYRVSKKTEIHIAKIGREFIAEIRQFLCVQPTGVQDVVTIV